MADAPLVVTLFSFFSFFYFSFYSYASPMAGAALVLLAAKGSAELVASVQKKSACAFMAPVLGRCRSWLRCWNGGGGGRGGGGGGGGGLFVGLRQAGDAVSVAGVVGLGTVGVGCVWLTMRHGNLDTWVWVVQDLLCALVLVWSVQCVRFSNFGYIFYVLHLLCLCALVLIWSVYSVRSSTFGYMWIVCKLIVIVCILKESHPIHCVIRYIRIMFILNVWIMCILEE
jgi:hypothetical protein